MKLPGDSDGCHISVTTLDIQTNICRLCQPHVSMNCVYKTLLSSLFKLRPSSFKGAPCPTVETELSGPRVMPRDVHRQLQSHFQQRAKDMPLGEEETYKPNQEVTGLRDLRPCVTCGQRNHREKYSLRRSETQLPWNSVAAAEKSDSFTFALGSFPPDCCTKPASWLLLALGQSKCSKHPFTCEFNW